MKVFISSVIGSFETFRDAAVRAISGLGYEVVRAEDFGASPDSPQQACLAAAREADLTILLLGARYGVKQASGLSATHEEYNEARKHRPVIVFVQSGIEMEPEQENFREEVRGWEAGHLTIGFATADELREAVTREVHRYMVAVASRPIDEQELLTHAQQALGTVASSWSTPQLVLSLASGPRQAVLRPSEIESQLFIQEIQRQALFGPHTLFAAAASTQTNIRAGWLVLSQESSTIEINSAGDIVIRHPALTDERGFHSLRAIIEEDVEEQLVVALQFSAAVLERIDAVHRLSHVGIVAALIGATYQGWRTRAEHARSPNSMEISSVREHAVVHLTPGARIRAEVGQRADEIAHDLMVLLRREFKQ